MARHKAGPLLISLCTKLIGFCLRLCSPSRNDVVGMTMRIRYDLQTQAVLHFSKAFFCIFASIKRAAAAGSTPTPQSCATANRARRTRWLNFGKQKKMKIEDNKGFIQGSKLFLDSWWHGNLRFGNETQRKMICTGEQKVKKITFNLNVLFPSCMNGSEIHVTKRRGFGEAGWHWG